MFFSQHYLLSSINDSIILWSVWLTDPENELCMESLPVVLIYLIFIPSFHKDKITLELQGSDLKIHGIVHSCAQSTDSSIKYAHANKSWHYGIISSGRVDKWPKSMCLFQHCNRALATDIIINCSMKEKACKSVLKKRGFNSLNSSCSLELVWDVNNCCT